MGDKLIEIEERDPKPSLREPIMCDCSNPGCELYLQVDTAGAMVTLHFGAVLHVLLDQNHALDLSLVLQEAVSDARAEG